MPETFRSVRLYFWPIIAANTLAMTAGAGGDVRRMAWFALALSSLASFGFVTNDLCDREIDRVNGAGHFERSRPSTLRLARAVAAALCVAGLATACVLGPTERDVSAGLAIGLAIYSPILRRTALVANVATAALASAPLWAPLLTAPSRGRPWQWALVSAAAVMLTAREIVMDVRDRRGDAAGGRKTLAIRLGARGSARLAAGLTAIALVPFGLAVLLGAAARSTAAIVLATATAAAIACLLVFAVSRVSTRSADEDAIRSYVRRSRLAMALLPVLSLTLSRL